MRNTHYPTMECPGCYRRIAVTARNQCFPHNDEPGRRCSGSHQEGRGVKRWPADEDPAVER